MNNHIFLLQVEKHKKKQQNKTKNNDNNKLAICIRKTHRMHQSHEL